MSHHIQNKLIGTGGMASVYEGFDEKLKRKVAIKVPSDVVRGDPDLLELFLGEARKMAQVSHPNVVSIYGVEEDGDQPRMIMELADGGSLLPIIRRGPMLSGSVADILRQCLEGLRAIHGEDIVHRDIKPENILIKKSKTGDAYKLGDFGIAKLADERTAPFRTDKYTAPECLLGKPASRTSDIYSLGLVAYELLLGQEGYHHVVRTVWAQHATGGQDIPWLRGSTSSDTTIPWHIWQGEAVELPRPDEVDDSIPTDLSYVVWNMVRKRRDDRTPNCDIALQALDSPALEGTAETRSDTIRVPDHPPLSSPPPPEPASAREPTHEEGATPEDAPAHTAAQSFVDTTPVEPDVRDTPRAPRRSGPPWLPLTAAALLFVVVAIVAFTFLREDRDDGVLEALRQRGMASWEAADYPAAINDFEMVLTREPDDTEIQLILGKAYYQTAKYTQASRLLESLLDTLPDEPEVPLYLGLTELSRGRTDDAIEHLDQAVGMAGDEHPEARFFLGFAYYKEGDWSEAREQFEAFLEVGAGGELESRARSLLQGIERRGASLEPEEPGNVEEPDGASEDVRLAYGEGWKLRGVEHDSTDLDSFVGSLLILHFWASWCQPCYEEMPSLLAFHEQDYPELEERGLALVTISNDYARKDLERFIADIIGDSSATLHIYWDPDWRLNESLGLGSALPQTVVVSRSGQVLSTLRQALDWQDPELLEQFQEWLELDDTVLT